MAIRPLDSVAAPNAREDQGMADSAQYHGIAPTPFPGLSLGLQSDGRAITCIDFLWSDGPQDASPGSLPRFPVVDFALAQLATFFRLGRAAAPVPVEPRGTPFQRRVWQAMLAIEPGHTRRYGDLANELGSSARAVGGACRANPIPFLIPCHRVVGAQDAGGFAGAQDGRLVELKRWLLAHERGA